MDQNLIDAIQVLKQAESLVTTHETRIRVRDAQMHLIGQLDDIVLFCKWSNTLGNQGVFIQ